jgi:hypothetical protein
MAEDNLNLSSSCQFLPYVELGLRYVSVPCPNKSFELRKMLSKVVLFRCHCSLLRCVEDQSDGCRV